MIGNSILDYVLIRICIVAFRLVAPLSALHAVASIYLGHAVVSKYLLYYTFLETFFFLGVYLPRKWSLQTATIHPQLLPRAERRALFEKCSQKMSEATIRPWFLQTESGRIMRDNAADWILWALFSTHEGEYTEEWEEEINEYLEMFAERLGRPLAQGRDANIKCMRLTLDPVVMCHRPFLWYMIVAGVDAFTSVRLTYMGFKHHNTRRWFTVFPPRPLLSLVSRPSCDPDISYWYRPHRSTTKRPILFIHGIGIGLYPYNPFFKELIAQDPDVGILAIEILSISMRITSPPPSRGAMYDSIARILAHHSLPPVTLISHSYGTIVTAHLLTSPKLAPRIANILFIDPIPFLLHHPAVAYNFVYRKPKRANEWQLWYFASRDPDIARALSRHFFWSENVLWKEDLQGKKVAVSLAGSDQIVDAKEVRSYLAEKSKEMTRWAKDDLEVLFYPGLDHATVFDTPQRRKGLTDIVHRFVEIET
ncbi:uncharacterized protein STEHIDRAFT_90320 [Stereum hirsutum FP-91666 SS1]|uniref:uncharacterized protein n=1 Tax=Stereum hirsutum (strain FP-91666) TaxID=721885 RepID=UPI000440CDDF|nr:uncharacterized protein STEHIDRAFT_90320 [Stereum hirsutum FP-91666 SS1]EIM92937.1 hypothetical protein STEHIDRAFT_90320 [Stereum hirsutum FP-91666 SS1]